MRKPEPNTEKLMMYEAILNKEKLIEILFFCFFRFIYVLAVPTRG
jgi:hypothetical protein